MSAIESINISDPALRDLIMNSFMSTNQISSVVDQVMNPVEVEPSYSWRSALAPVDEMEHVTRSDQLEFVPQELSDNMNELIQAVDDITFGKINSITGFLETPVEKPVKKAVIKEKKFFNRFSEIFNMEVEPRKINYDAGISIKSVIELGSTRQIHIVIVGVGGTGSRLVALIAQLMLSRPNIKLHLIDPDVVEQKNLLRQNFFDFEIGDYKVNALADRYAAIYGIKIFTHNIKMPIDFKISNEAESLIIFDCTDNLTARQSIDVLFNVGFDRYRNLKQCVLISCGNQKDFGQVHFGYRGVPLVKPKNLDKAFINNTQYVKNLFPFIDTAFLSENLIKIFTDIYNFQNIYCKSDKDIDISYLPSFLQFNKDFKDSKESISCANFDIAEEQSMAINCTIAQIAFNMLFEFLSSSGIKHNVVWANLTNSYSGNQINTVEKYLNCASQTVFGKSVGFELDKYNQVLVNLTSKFSNLVSEQVITMYELSRALNDDYHQVVLNGSSESSRYYISPNDVDKIVDLISIDLFSFLDKDIFDKITKDNFYESYLNYIIVLKIMNYIFYSLQSSSSIHASQTVHEKVINLTYKKYGQLFLDKQAEYNLSIIKVG